MKKKLLPLALAAAAGLTGVTAQAAMTVNPDGTGQLLMYPIYTANGGNDTYISLVNTTDKYKAVKVRFVDAMNSQDSLDFHLYLSPKDHWSGVVTKSGDGAVLKTGDTSCTVPNILASKKPGELGTTALLRNSKYATGGAEADAKNNGLDRTLEGHVEVFEMGQLADGDASGTDAQKLTAKLQAAALHSKGIPADCKALESAWTTAGFKYTDTDDTVGNPRLAAGAGGPTVALDAPTGGLYGYGVVINVPDGSAAMFDAVAVDGFMTAAYHPTPGDDEPGIDDGTNESVSFVGGALSTFTANVEPDAGFTGGTLADDGVIAPGETSINHVAEKRGLTGSRKAGGGAAVYGSAGSKEALSALLAKTSISNDYVLEPTLNAATDWVVTFPTKRDFVNMAANTEIVKTSTTITVSGTGAFKVAAEQPFTNLWDHAKTESCDEITLTYYDREEGVETVTVGVDFSPAPVTVKDKVSLCTESNILNFNGKGVLGGSDRITKNTTLASGFNNGWATVGIVGGTLTDLNAASAGDNSATIGTTVVTGRPVIGFAIQKYVNGDVNGLKANYAGSIGHHYTRAAVAD